MKKTTIKTAPSILLALILFSPIGASANGLWVHHSVEEEFETIREYIEEGITNQGLVVAHRSDVGGMLERTGNDLASKVSQLRSSVEEGIHSVVEAARDTIGIESEEQPQGESLAETSSAGTFVSSEVIEFCSANLSRKMTDADPANVIFCPYSIALYTTTADPDTVHISYLQLSRIGSARSRAVLEEVEAMLEQIVTEATE